MKKVILLILLLPMLASAQYFDVFDIDTTDYPIMKAKFYSIDANGNQILNHTPSDFEITENGEPRDVISVSCPEQVEEPFSVVIAVDISSSMSGSRIENTKSAIKSFIDLIPNNGSEIAIIAFNNENHFISDFSRNKKQLKARVENFKVGGGTNFNAAFLDPLAGSLLAILNAKHLKRNIVIITDGSASGNEDEIINSAINSNTKIYSIIIGTTAPNILSNISKETGGEVFNGLIEKNEFSESFKNVLDDNINNPCEIIWNSERVCSSIKITVDLKWKDIRNLNSFYPPENKLSELVAQPNYIKFGLKEPGFSFDTTIIVSARFGDFEIQSIEPKYGDSTEISFVNFNLPFLLRDGESKKITLRFTPKDSSLKYVSFDINSINCSTPVYVSGGSNIKNSKSSLEIIQPNGGEMFAVTMDTIISWEGVSPTDSVYIDFSIDKGITWKNITKSAKNNRFRWENIPMPPSTKCLIRVRQGEYLEEVGDEGESSLKKLWEKVYDNEGTNGSGNSLAMCSDGNSVLVGNTSSDNNYDLLVIKFSQEDGSILWQKTFGGSKYESASSIIESSDGNLVIAGGTESSNGDILENRGSSDFWILKISSLDGSILWQRTFGGSKYESASSIIESSDGNLVITGGTSSSNGDIYKTQGYTDFWIIKVSSIDGSLIWQKNYGGLFDEFSNSIIESSDRNLVIIGNTYSRDGDVTENKGNLDIWVLKVSSIDGSLIWQKTYGGSKRDVPRSIIEDSEGNYVVVGYTASNNGDISKNYGEDDIWIIRINPIDGTLIWEKNYGGNYNDRANSIIQNSEGDLLLVGSIQQKNDLYKDVLIKIDPFLGEIITEIYINSDNKSSNFPVLIENFIGQYTIVTKYIDKYILLLKYSEPILIQSDTSDAVFSIIMPEPVIKNNDINMGQMIVGSTKDTIVSSVICNIGDAPLHVLGVDITGGDASDFLIPRGAGDFYLEKDECQDMMFEFTPSALGDRTAVATIRTTIGDFTDSINIRGVGIDPVIEATAELVDFGLFELGDGKDTTAVLIKNVGSTDINITDTRISGPDMEQFTLNSIPLSYTIAAGQEKEFQLNYTAKFGGKSNSYLDFHYEGIGSPLRSLLFAEGIGGEVYPVVADAFVGETINLELFLGKIKPDGLSEIASNFSATVSYNSTLLAPIDKSILVTTEDNKSYIRINGKLSGVSQIATVPMKVGLGTDDRSGLVITEFQLYDANGDSVDYDIEPGVGEFNVMGICEEGGKRLINPNGETVEMQVIPENNLGNAYIHLTLIETGQTELEIYDQVGNKVETVYSGTSSAGSQEINLDLSKYANGRYYIKLTTPTITKTEIIEVVR